VRDNRNTDERKDRGEVRHFTAREKTSEGSQASPVCPSDEDSVQVKTLGWLEAVAWERCRSIWPRDLSQESELLKDWPFTASQFVLAPSSLRHTTRDFCN
jgi:hypothetical protein